MYPTGKGKRAGRAHRKCSSRVFLLGMRGQTTVFPLSFLLSTLLFAFVWRSWGQGDRGALLGPISIGLGQDMVMYEKPPPLRRQRPWTFGPHVAG